MENELTVNSLRALLETSASVGIGVSTVGGIVLWLFREKIGAWVDARVTTETDAHAERLDALEDRMAEQEKTSVLVAQSLKHLTEGFERVTKVLDRVELRASETSQAVARIEGTMERRANARGPS